MPLPPIIFAADEPVRVIVPTDDAIDTDATPADALQAYAAGDDPDVDTLVLKAGAQPTWFTVRALTMREMRIVRSRVALAEDGETGRERLVRLVETVLQFVRFGLIDVEGWQGWADAERERVFGLQAWPESVIAAMPDDVLMFVGNVIMRLSTLDEKKSESPGLSPTKRNGTKGRKSTGAARGRARSTAKAAGKTNNAARI